MISGVYVERFRDANLGMLQGASLNAPYEFHWLWVTAVEDEHIVCRTRLHGGREMRLLFERLRTHDRAEVTVADPIFGPTKFMVLPFKGEQI